MNSTDVLDQIEQAREEGDFDLVKRLSKEELENPHISDKYRLLIMDQVAHMYLDSFLIWVNEMKRIDMTENKRDVLRRIAQNSENTPHKRIFYTAYMRKMIEAEPEEVRNVFLSVDEDVEKAKEAKKDDRGIL